MRLLLLALITLSVVSGDARAQTVPYTVEMTGVADTDLRRRIEEHARLFTLAAEPPASLEALKHRVEGDEVRIQEVLRSEGYYDARADFAILDEDARPVPVRITVEPGAEFTLQSYDVRYQLPEGAPPPGPVELEKLGLRIGQRARAQLVAEARPALLRILADRGYPLAMVEDRLVEVDHAANAMRVTVTVDTGGLARFGEVEIEGLEDVSQAVITRRIPWKEGDVFSVTEVEELRQSLQDTRLFSLIRIATADELGEDGRLPITIGVEEALHRSIGFSANWSSTEGFGGGAFWEHRNLLGGGERLRASANAGEIRTALDLLYREPDFFSVGQSLLVSGTVEEMRTDAFLTQTVGTSAVVERALTETWTVSGGIALERTIEEERLRRSIFTLVSFPLEARHDTTNSVLDPTQGNRLRVTVQPFVEALGTTGFTRMSVSDSVYWKLREQSPRLVAAGWARLGTIRGANSDDVPADKRFYVGGGGSVRPFGFQLAGPLDAQGEPTGGLSSIGFGGELRVRATESIEVVPFLEAGRAYAEQWPQLGDEVLWGGGLGVRYHTPIGPVRADIAVPVNPRPNIDDSYQVYLSLGQAF